MQPFCSSARSIASQAPHSVSGWWGCSRSPGGSPGRLAGLLEEQHGLQRQHVRPDQRLDHIQHARVQQEALVQRQPAVQHGCARSRSAGAGRRRGRSSSRDLVGRRRARGRSGGPRRGSGRTRSTVTQWRIDLDAGWFGPPQRLHFACCCPRLMLSAGQRREWPTRPAGRSGRGGSATSSSCSSTPDRPASGSTATPRRLAAGRGRPAAPRPPRALRVRPPTSPRATRGCRCCRPPTSRRLGLPAVLPAVARARGARRRGGRPALAAGRARCSRTSPPPRSGATPARPSAAGPSARGRSTTPGATSTPTSHDPGLALGDVARAAHVTPAHLVRAFRAEHGTTPMAYLWQRRVALGVDLLDAHRAADQGRRGALRLPHRPPLLAPRPARLRPPAGGAATRALGRRAVAAWASNCSRSARSSRR